MKKHLNRETWLEHAITLLDKKFFMENGYELPEKLQVSCGFPRSSSKIAIGQCWAPASSANSTTHMFICPTQADPIQVIGILLHEMIHASVGLAVGHRGIFRKLVKEFGLAGKMTATVVEDGSPLWAEVYSMSARLGDYPHAALTKPAKKGSSGSKKGWRRMVSITDPAYKVSIHPLVLDELGAPVDPWGESMVPCK